MKLKSEVFKLMLLFACTLSGIITNTMLNAQTKIGVFADCQYCNCEPKGERYYKNSLNKLNDCISTFNNQKVEFVVGLGDLIDKDFSSFEDVRSVLNHSKSTVYHVTGNHDFSVKPEYTSRVLEALNLKNGYYAIEEGNWLFLFLNGNELSLHAENPQTVAKAKEVLNQLSANNQPNNKEWNGGLGSEQIKWLEKKLKHARDKNVVLFCHYPILPLEKHALWEALEVKQLLEKHDNVKAWVNGHNHAGNYVKEKGIHYLTLQGMVDTPAENAFAIFTFHDEQIVVDGFGREEKRILPIK